MFKLLNIGFGNFISGGRLVSIVSPDAAPIKRIIQGSREAGTLIDSTCGRRTRSVLVMDSGHIVLSSVMPETVAQRIAEE
ncbi:MAG: DUF370 domain-containing protein [Clostridiales bacterium]|jgi:regulator of extracellular matrix RemA (YlzA/DUF370 family)|nr:DUF370 domain-containing protein [Clostridiales bacterium]